MQSLPEAVLLAVDTTARHCIELSRELIDLDQLVTNFPELRASGADANRVPGSAVKRGKEHSFSSNNLRNAAISISVQGAPRRLELVTQKLL